MTPEHNPNNKTQDEIRYELGRALLYKSQQAIARGVAYYIKHNPGLEVVLKFQGLLLEYKGITDGEGNLLEFKSSNQIAKNDVNWQIIDDLIRQSLSDDEVAKVIRSSFEMLLAANSLTKTLDVSVMNLDDLSGLRNTRFVRYLMEQLGANLSKEEGGRRAHIKTKEAKDNLSPYLLFRRSIESSPIADEISVYENLIKTIALYIEEYNPDTFSFHNIEFDFEHKVQPESLRLYFYRNYDLMGQVINELYGIDLPPLQEKVDWEAIAPFIASLHMFTVDELLQELGNKFQLFPSRQSLIAAVSRLKQRTDEHGNPLLDKSWSFNRSKYVSGRQIRAVIEDLLDRGVEGYTIDMCIQAANLVDSDNYLDPKDSYVRKSVTHLFEKQLRGDKHFPEQIQDFTFNKFSAYTEEEVSFIIELKLKGFKHSKIVELFQKEFNTSRVPRVSYFFSNWAKQQQES